LTIPGAEPTFARKEKPGNGAALDDGPEIEAAIAAAESGDKIALEAGVHVSVRGPNRCLGQPPVARSGADLIATRLLRDVNVVSRFVWTTSHDEFCNFDATVKSMHLGTLAITTVFSACETPYNVVADAGFVYYTNWTTNQIVRQPITGGAETILATADGLVYRRAMAQDAGYIYFGDDLGIHRVQKTGGPGVPIATDVGAANSGHLAVDDSYVYWSDSTWVPGTGRLRAISKAGGKAVNIQLGSTVPDAIQLGVEQVYWTTYDGIWRLRPALVFADGFESGNTSFWSLTAP